MMKEYSNGEIVVNWKPNKCMHAGECVRGLPQVFNREKHPWVNIRAAKSEEIMRVIDKCPTGALSYRIMKNEVCPEEPSAKIRVTKNGPLIVEGNCTLIEWTDKETAINGRFALCRCGASKNKPFCDGTHIKIGFDDSIIISGI